MTAKFHPLRNLQPTSNYFVFMTECGREIDVSTRENFQTARDGKLSFCGWGDKRKDFLIKIFFPSCSSKCRHFIQPGCWQRYCSQLEATKKHKWWRQLLQHQMDFQESNLGEKCDRSQLQISKHDEQRSIQHNNSSDWCCRPWIANHNQPWQVQ